jgi:dihydrofolate reductase
VQSRKPGGVVVGPLVADMSVSLDGFVADQDDGVEGVFSWYGKPQAQPGDGEPEGDGGVKAAVGMGHELGVLIYGRRTFEIADGWGGAHPTGRRSSSSRIACPTAGLATIARFASRRGSTRRSGWPRLWRPTRSSPSPPRVSSQQLLDRNLLDGVRLSVVPALLGRGTRYFDHLHTAPIDLDGPIVQAGNGVTHLYYAVRR